MPLAAAAVTVAVLLHGSDSQAATVSSKPTLKAMVAEATQLSNEVDSLGQQYDGLKIQLAHANSEVKVAKLAAARAEAAMAGSQKAVAQLAAMGYMNGGMDPTLQMLTSSDPGAFLGEASTVQQINDEAGMRLSTLQKEQIAAERAQVTATEEIATANQIQSQINGKVKTINAKLSVLNSSTMRQACGSAPCSASNSRRNGRRRPPRKRSRPPTSCSRRSTARSRPSTPSWTY